MNKKGFTLVELLVVVLIISIVMALHRLSHNKAIANRNNEIAVSMFMELTNAARLHNEVHPDQKIAGGFNDNEEYCSGCTNPCNLFEDPTATDQTRVAEDYYALNPVSWGIESKAACNGTLNYRGYTFILCNPNFKNTSPDRQPCTDCTNERFAILKNSGGVVEAYLDKDYKLVNNFSVRDI